MYLEKYIGYHVTFDLVEAVRHDRTLRVFYETDRHNGYIRNKLIAVDKLGIWVEGFKNTKIYKDDDGNDIIPPKEEELNFHLLIRWEYLQGVFVVAEPELNDKKIGFNR